MYLNRVKKQSLLQVFNLIISLGQKVDDVYKFAGISAAHDFDGYTCYLTYRDLTVSLLFHGSYDFDYQNEQTLVLFFDKVAKLLAEQAN